LRWSSTTPRTCAVAAVAAAALGGCGLAVKAPDLFLLTRTGPGGKLSILVSDAGTISCNGSKPKPLTDAALIAARDLATNLDNDAKAGLRLKPTASSVYSYTVKMQDGTISFPDAAAIKHAELGPLEQFVLQQAQATCVGDG
jgi:hypothetical protein